MNRLMKKATVSNSPTTAAALLFGVLFLIVTLFLGHLVQSVDDANLISVPSNLSRKRRSHLRSFNTEIDPTNVRELFEKDHSYPPNLQEAIQELHKTLPPVPSDLPYDIHNCPFEPPDGYPYAWHLLDILENWNPDQTELPDQMHQGLCVFDWNNDREKAANYRELEVPFVVQNHPELLKTAYRWNSPDYIQQMVGRKDFRNEHSSNNHMMFWRTRHLPKKSIPSGWKAPTNEVGLSFTEWKKKAQEIEKVQDQTTQDHWYFRLNAVVKEHGGVNSHIYKEFPFFEPSSPSFFMVDPAQERGINCRFGMKGIIAEAHFDPSRNFVVLLGGQRRYILSHPSQCKNMELWGLRHPSGRHSKVNWSNPPDRSENRPFTRAESNEVVLQAGDTLYLPTSWFHFIVSLNENYQCNARSGVTYENEHFIKECGLGRSPSAEV